MATVDISKKQMIMEAAAKLFRDRGYSATSMRDLAKAVHLQASSLYNHIKSKQEILKEICFHNARHFLAGIEQIVQEEASPAQQLEALILLHLRVATSDATSITSFNDEWRHLEQPELEQFINLRKRYEAHFRDIIEKGIAAGDFRQVDPNIVMYTILSSLRWVYDWYRPERADSIEEIGQEIVSLVLKGLQH
ncbi:MAG: TetR/AcrR family transcriptional regulator [Bacteroidota bacterium]